MKTMENEIEWEDLDDGDLMTLEEFIDCVRAGAFMSSDGCGYFAIADKKSNLPVCFNVAMLINIANQKKYTHVQWYNR